MRVLIVILLLLGSPHLAVADAEIEGCNSSSVKAILFNGTYEKWKAGALQTFRHFSSATFKKADPYVCPPFKAPYTGPETQSGYVAGRGYRAPNNAPYRPDDQRGLNSAGQHNGRSTPLTAADYLESHRKSCAFEDAQLEEREKARETEFNRRQQFAAKGVELISRVSVSIANVRQQNYDKANNVRLCIADFQYEPDLTALGLQSPACAKTIAYKIEPLLDKPSSYYASWRCL